MFEALKKHYEKSGDDVLIVQSHKFLNSVSSNEKDFLLVNVTKGKDYYIDGQNTQLIF